MFIGPPGAGKSTTGGLLGKNHGYIYYEADCFGMFANPFVDPNVEEPTLQILKQTPLKVWCQIPNDKIFLFFFTKNNFAGCV